jgi:hypothetical protein
MMAQSRGPLGLFRSVLIRDFNLTACSAGLFPTVGSEFFISLSQLPHLQQQLVRSLASNCLMDMAANSLFSGSSSADDDCALTASQIIITEEPMAASKSVTCHTQGRVTFQKATPCTSNIHTNEKRPWGSGSPRRESTSFDRPYPTILSSPSKKCYGAPDLSTSKRSERDGKKTLAELRRVTKFPMVSASSQNFHFEGHCISQYLPRSMFWNIAHICSGQRLLEKIGTIKTRSSELIILIHPNLKAKPLIYFIVDTAAAQPVHCF